MKAALIVCLLVSTAAAAPTDEEQAESYLAAYNADPQAAGGDETLYNAGVSFESAHSVAGAIRAFDMVRQQYPKSKLVMRATARLANLYASIAMYDRAADYLEEYAKKYAGEKDAFDAISDAAYYRKATGNRTKAIEDTQYFIKLYGAKRPREAADAMWSLAALYEGDAQVKHLREYLRMFGAKGGAGHVVIAHAKIGQQLLKQSCSVHGVDGLCASVVETPRTCGKGTATTFKVTARDSRKITEARAELDQAIREYERTMPPDDLEARYFYAQALLATADPELETYLGLAPPRADMKAFATWLEQKQKAGSAVMRKYEAVLAAKDIASSVTASARISIVSQAFATSVATLAMPRDIKSDAQKQKAYCDGMNDVIEPLEASAATSFGVCLAKSTELAWFSDSSALCERVLAELAPDQFPLAHELRSDAAQYAPVTVAEPAILGR